MNICKRCGKENQEHYKFCLGCGGELTSSAAPASAPQKTIMAQVGLSPMGGPPPGAATAPTPPGGVPALGAGPGPSGTPGLGVPVGLGSPPLSSPHANTLGGPSSSPPLGGSPSPYGPASSPYGPASQSPYSPPLGGSQPSSAPAKTVMASNLGPAPMPPSAVPPPSGWSGPTPGAYPPGPAATPGYPPASSGFGAPPGPPSSGFGTPQAPQSPFGGPSPAPSSFGSPMTAPGSAYPPPGQPAYTGGGPSSAGFPAPSGFPGTSSGPNAAVAPGGGARLCPNCGSEVPGSFQFCGNCGSRLGAPSVSARGMTGELAARPAPVAEPKPHGRLTLIRPDGSEGGVHELTEDENRIGRSHGQVFENDGYLSPSHAEVVLNAAGAVIRDLESLNGVFCKMQGEEELQAGDVFRIGQELLRYDVISPPQPLEDGTEIMGSPNPGYWGRLSVIIGKEIDGSAYPLFGDTITIGRERGDINFPDDGYVSGMHARVTQRDGKAFIVDLGSSNGTFVKLRGERAVQDGAFVLFGQQLFRVNLNVG